MDIAYLYDSEKGFSDMKIIGGDFLLCDSPRFDPTTSKDILKSSLQVAVELALFTDRRATTEEIRDFQQGRIERISRRGYWANTYKDNRQGSGLWLLSRAKRTQTTLSKAETYCTDSLQWMIDVGVIESVDPSASYSGEALVLQINITKPDGQGYEFRWQFTWDGIEEL